MYKLCFYVPVTHAENVKREVFLTGAGRIGNYDNCSWECLGSGQFRALSGSKPFVGQHGLVEKVAELKIELVCEDSIIHQAIAVMKHAHPYEQPAYDVLKLEDL